MKNRFFLSAAIFATLSATSAFADTSSSALCQGLVDVEDVVVGCGEEYTRTVPIAKCDFREGKSPSIMITSVIDGRGSDTSSVSVQDVDTESFTVLITPKTRSPGYCKVENFRWAAE